ncbi:MAG TPA: YraN family protein [Alphaproteobacteria bacterium]|nr:YraN family protein [Alphaproteobacteria bacterium]
MARSERLRAVGRGRTGEWLAALRLMAAGYRIVARNFRSPVGEIDLIARRGRTLVFVEVKHRSGRAAAAESILPRQQARIRRAAEAFLVVRPELATFSLRFDAMLIAPWRVPQHIVDAWRDAGARTK